jgi:hypothetical protein
MTARQHRVALTREKMLPGKRCWSVESVSARN